jgi:hypothetical protein
MRTKYRNGDEISLAENGCDGCSPANINGVFCHETGCPESWRDHEVECDECGDEFYPESRGERICKDCIDDADDWFSDEDDEDEDEDEDDEQDDDLDALGDPLD